MGSLLDERPLVQRSKKRATVKRRILNIKKRILSRFVKKGKHQQKIISTVANNATLYSWFIKNAIILGTLSTTALLAAIHSASKKKTASRERKLQEQLEEQKVATNKAQKGWREQKGVDAVIKEALIKTRKKERFASAIKSAARERTLQEQLTAARVEHRETQAEMLNEVAHWENLYQKHSKGKQATIDKLKSENNAKQREYENKIREVELELRRNREASFERTSSSSSQNITDSDPLRRQPQSYHQELLQSNKRLQPVTASDKSQNKGHGSMTNELAAAIRQGKSLRKGTIQLSAWEKEQEERPTGPNFLRGPKVSRKKKNVNADIKEAHERYLQLLRRQRFSFTRQTKKDISLIREECGNAYRSLIDNEGSYQLTDYNDLLNLLQETMDTVTAN